MKFLQKIIDVVKLVTKQNLTVKPSKVVAGLEAELTNELLQAIGFALENNLDSKEAVEIVKSGNAPVKSKNKVEARESLTRRSSKDKDSLERKSKTESSTKKLIKQGSKDKTITKQGSTERIIPKTDKTTTKLKPKDKVAKEKEAAKRSTSKSKPEIKEKSQKTIKKVPSKDIIVENNKTNGDVITNERMNGEIIDTTANHASLQSNEESDKKSIIEIKENGDAHPDEISMNHNETILNESGRVNGNGNSHYENEDAPKESKPVDDLAAIIDEEAEMRRKERLSRKLSSKHRQKTVEESQSQEKSSTENNDQPTSEVPTATPAPAPVIANVPLPVQKQNSKEQAEKIERFHSSYKRDSFDRPKTSSLRPPSARPPSARPAAPRRRDKNIEIVLQPDEHIKLGEINVKMESFSKELEDDGENLVIIEDPTLATDNIIGNRMAGADGSNKINESDDHGHLVQQILETQKEFSGVLGMGEEQGQRKTEIEYDENMMSNQRQSSAKQVDHLKDLIQKLTRSVNPMGKLMDFVQEDVDSMQREYTKWHEIYKTATFELKNKQTETANAIEPLKHQLTSLENSIKEHRDLIDGIRSNIIQNEQKILKIFTDT